MPCDPTYDRSLRSLAELTPQTAASSSLDTVSVPCSVSSPSIRRYTASRATVASGTVRASGATSTPAPVEGGADDGREVTLGLSSGTRERQRSRSVYPVRGDAQEAGAGGVLTATLRHGSRS